MKKVPAVLLAISLAGTIWAQDAPHRPFGVRVPPYAAGTQLPAVGKAAMDRAVVDYYRKWKAAYLVPFLHRQDWQAIRSLDASHPYVAEAQGYGLEILALMTGVDPDARKLFDGVLQYVLDHPSQINPALMAAEQDKKGASVNGGDSATDGDLAIAYGLLLADRQWGSKGAFDYKSLALSRIAAIKKSEIHPRTKLPLLGDWAGPDNSYYHSTRPSDFMLDHFRAFRAATSDEFWDSVIASIQGLITHLQTKYALATGLVPDFVVETNTADPRPAPRHHLERETDGDYSYNVTRLPWRLGQDGAIFGDRTSREQARRMTKWIKAATAGQPVRIKAGYTLGGKPMENYSDIIFTATFAPAAMFDPADQAWLDALWAEMSETAVAGELDGYYGSSLLLQTMILVSGNYWSPAK